ncbi:protein FAM76B [Drosophila rhopaloa]|uniref:Protein FAM76B n=1 Tax=Drosophila rhopaloa TaxID=1041015 RepID=A0A6P4E5K7_DRORH|nr:protein FAM76B [Drosophila rhopaloa]
MDLLDNKLYMCTQCFQRCLWTDLSEKEHRCSNCRLQPKECAICGKKFEPRNKSHSYCKRCDFYIQKHAVVKPPPIQKSPEGQPYGEQTREGSSITERWREIRAASGIDDDLSMSD